MALSIEEIAIALWIEQMNTEELCKIMNMSTK